MSCVKTPGFGAFLTVLSRMGRGEINRPYFDFKGFMAES